MNKTTRKGTQFCSGCLKGREYMGELSQIRGGLVFWVLILRSLTGCYECFGVMCCCLLPKLDEAH